MRTYEWYDARRDQDEIDCDEPNSGLLRYSEEERDLILNEGKNEANNPLNRMYNEKPLEFSAKFDSHPWDDYSEDDRGQEMCNMWTYFSNILFDYWPRYVDSGVAGKLSFNEFLDVFEDLPCKLKI